MNLPIFIELTSFSKKEGMDGIKLHANINTIKVYGECADQKGCTVIDLGDTHYYVQESPETIAGLIKAATWSH